MRCLEVFQKACEYAVAAGFKDIKSLPGCAELPIDGDWSLAINGHSTLAKTSEGIDVQPFTIYFEWRGWPFGNACANGGQYIQGTAVNEELLLAALDEAISRIGKA